MRIMTLTTNYQSTSIAHQFHCLQNRILFGSGEENKEYCWFISSQVQILNFSSINTSKKKLQKRIYRMRNSSSRRSRFSMRKSNLHGHQRQVSASYFIISPPGFRLFIYLWKGSLFKISTDPTTKKRKKEYTPQYHEISRHVEKQYLSKG